jgi:hypothetical protein
MNANGKRQNLIYNLQFSSEIENSSCSGGGSKDLTNSDTISEDGNGESDNLREKTDMSNI